MKVDILTSLFWISSFLVIYPYLIYPFLIRTLAKTLPSKQPATTSPPLPTVTLVISAYNEEAVIRNKLENACAMEYPKNLLEIIVVSDASDDKTDEIVKRWNDGRTTLIRQEERKGKSAGLNLALAIAKGDIVVFSDANAMYDKNALTEMIKPFADPAVGHVVGSALYYDGEGNEAKESEGLYWKLELWLKKQESDFDSVVGGDGAIQAIRRTLFTNLEADDINDFVTPLQIVAKGYRGIFNPNAICYEDAGDEFEKEFNRKRRIVNRTWRATLRYGGLLSPTKNTKYLFMLISHKILRWFGLLFAIIATLLNITILTYTDAALLYGLTLTGILLSVLLALAGNKLSTSNRSLPSLLYVPYYFYFVHLSALLGIWDQFRGVKHVTWQHIRK